MAKRLFLLRHARLGPDSAGRLIGASDLPLDSVGREQAAASADRLAGLAVQRYYASPMLRCRETAAAVFPARRFELDNCLREIDFGAAEGRRFNDVAAENPDLARRWAEFAPTFAFPGGETLASFLERVGTAVDRLTNEDAESVLAVTHGGVIRAMICRLLGLEPRNYVLFDVGYLGLVEIRLFEGRGVLARLDNSFSEEARDG